MTTSTVSYSVAIGVFATLLIASSAPVPDPLLGDRAAGLSYAQQQCASCHAISPGDLSSPRKDATPFERIANTPGMTQTALHVFFKTPHTNMPNLIIPPDDADNVISYILSLKDKS